MARTLAATAVRVPSGRALVELLKPVTWFPPMWAFACGVISASGFAAPERWPFIVAGVLLAGPLVCGTSQVVNDWFDRDVDAINEPHRPIPSGRVPGRWGLGFAIAWTLLSLLVAAALGTWVFVAACGGMALAWAYSAPPFRLKQNGWLGAAAVGFCYEGLPWFTAAAVVSGGLPSTPILLLALLYSIGAHGIMILNDFKAVDGDRQMGIASVPVQLGPRRAAWVACAVMAIPQFVVVGLLASWGRPEHAAAVAGVVLLQLLCMARLMGDPKRLAPWYNATGVTLYVSGMMISAFAVATGGLA
ncbi:MAG: chlorophyll synthase ChlG [Pseudomonadota bacterium]